MMLIKGLFFLIVTILCLGMNLRGKKKKKKKKVAGEGEEDPLAPDPTSEKKRCVVGWAVILITFCYFLLLHVASY